MSLRATRDFAETSPSETRDVGFDYSYDLADGEKISSASFTLAVDGIDDGATEDSSPSSRKVGSATIEDSLDTELVDAVAVQRITGLLDGNIYRVICRATTDNGQVLELFAHIASRVAN